MRQLVVEQDEENKSDRVREFNDLIGPLMLLVEPLSSRSIANFLQIDHEDVRLRLDWFHSVLSVPEEENSLIRPLHLSFRDFLANPNKRYKSEFWVDKQQVHDSLATTCLGHLTGLGGLK